jgi:hypothetical protein
MKTLDELDKFMALPPDERDKVLYFYVMDLNNDIKDIKNNLKILKYFTSILLATTLPLTFTLIVHLLGF